MERVAIDVAEDHALEEPILVDGIRRGEDRALLRVRADEVPVAPVRVDPRLRHESVCGSWTETLMPDQGSGGPASNRSTMTASPSSRVMVFEPPPPSHVAFHVPSQKSSASGPTRRSVGRAAPEELAVTCAFTRCDVFDD